MDLIIQEHMYSRTSTTNLCIEETSVKGHHSVSQCSTVVSANFVECTYRDSYWIEGQGKVTIGDITQHKIVSSNLLFDRYAKIQTLLSLVMTPQVGKVLNSSTFQRDHSTLIS